MTIFGYFVFWPSGSEANKNPTAGSGSGVEKLGRTD
jgi:hypothetical protein